MKLILQCTHDSKYPQCITESMSTNQTILPRLSIPTINYMRRLTFSINKEMNREASIQSTLVLSLKLKKHYGDLQDARSASYLVSPLRLVALLLLHLYTSDHDCTVRCENIILELSHSLTSIYPSSLKQTVQSCWH